MPMNDVKPALPAADGLRPGRSIGRVAEFGLMAVGAVVVVSPSQLAADLLIVWLALALGYLVVGAIALRRSRLTVEVAPGAASRWMRRYTFGFALLASVIGLIAALTALVNDTGKGELQAVVRVACVLIVLTAWLVFHAGFGRFYSAVYYGDGPAARGLNFPDTPMPAAVDFMYFAFTVGATFGTSDVTVVNRALRWHVLVHSVLSFLYNTTVVATTVAVLTSVV